MRPRPLHGLLLFLWLALPVSAQEARPAATATATAEGAGLEGVVRGRPADGSRLLAYAVVRVVGAEESAWAWADEEGRYRITGLEGGSVTVQASYLGYDPAEVEVVLPAEGVVRLDLEMTHRPLKLPGLVVEGERFAVPQPAEGMPETITTASTLVRLRALEASPGMSEAGLTEVVGRQDGEPPDPPGALYMRGSTEDLKLVLLDGAPVYTPFHLGGLLQSFDGAVLGGARYHVGGAPAQYDGGLSYVLDLRTRSPRRDRTRARAAVDIMSVGGSAEGPLGDAAGALLSSRHLHGLGGVIAGGDGSPYGYSDALARFEADAVGRLELTVFANRESVFLDLPDSLGLPSGQDASWGNTAVSVAWETELGSALLRIGAAESRYTAELPVRESPVIGSGDGDVETTFLATGRTDRSRFTVDASRPGDAGLLHLGLTMDRLDLWYGARGRGSVPARGAHGTTVGIYADGTRGLARELTLRWGARLDRFQTDPGIGHRSTDVRGALRLALAWGLAPDALLTLAAGRYHQLVRRSDADLELGTGDAIQVGTGSGRSAPLLSVATADHLVASLDQRIGEDVRLGTELFFKTFEGVPGVGTGRLTSSGVDLRVLREGQRVTGWLGYSLAWFWEGSTGDQGRTGFSGRHLLSSGVEAELPGPLGLDLRMAFSDGLPLTQVAPVDSRDEIQSISETHDVEEEVPIPEPRPDPGVADGFLRLDGELFAEWEVGPLGRTSHLRPYLKVLNALERRDALFYYFEPWRDQELRPLANLSLIPVVGLEWRF